MNLVTVYGSMQKQAASPAAGKQVLSFLGKLFSRPATVESVARNANKAEKTLAKATKPLLQHADDVKQLRGLKDEQKFLSLLANNEAAATQAAGMTGDIAKAQKAADKTRRAAAKAREAVKPLRATADRLGERAANLAAEGQRAGVALDRLNQSRYLSRGRNIATGAAAAGAILPPALGVGYMTGSALFPEDPGSTGEPPRSGSAAKQTENQALREELPPAKSEAPKAESKQEPKSDSKKSEPAKAEAAAAPTPKQNAAPEGWTEEVTDPNYNHSGSTNTTTTEPPKAEGGINPEWAGLGAGALGATGIYAGLGLIPAIRRRRILRAMAALAGGAGLGYGAYQLAQPKTASYTEFKAGK